MRPWKVCCCFFLSYILHWTAQRRLKLWRTETVRAVGSAACLPLPRILRVVMVMHVCGRSKGGREIRTVGCERWAVTVHFKSSTWPCAAPSVLPSTFLPMLFHVWKDSTRLSVVGADVYCTSQHIFFFFFFVIQMFTNHNPPEEKNPLALFPPVIDFIRGSRRSWVILINKKKVLWIS